MAYGRALRFGHPVRVAPADQADDLRAGDRMREHARVHHRRLDRPSGRSVDTTHSP
ncbi:MAG: hypothetical protein M3Z75_32670 [Actinomycetota bacterium]|nr:hypothetical protein [Actinomycetota bacterium]